MSRRFRKRRPVRRARFRMSRRLPLGGFAASKVVRLRYAENISLNPTAGAVAAYYFSANGLYDPNITGTGHQPNGFDELMLHYNHYRVIGSKITVNYAQNASQAVIESTNPGLFGVALVPDATSLSAYTRTYEIIESRVGNRKYGYAGDSQANMKKIVRNSFSHRKFFKTKIWDDKFRGNSAANPSEQAYYGVWFGAPDGSLDPGITNFMIVIEYIAIMNEPIPLGPS